MPKPPLPQTPADRLIQHLRDGSALYVSLAARDQRWVAARAAVLFLDKNKKRFWASLALDALRVRIAQRIDNHPDFLELL